MASEVKRNQTDDSNSIRTLFKDKVVFITGGTGFMGKVLIEKLLRSCPDLKLIYVLIRSKKGESIETRLEKILDSQLFGRLKDVNFAKKIQAVNGDIIEENFGLSDEDREAIVENVQIVFHSAATVKFDEDLSLALKINVLGTKKMVHLCHEIKNLEVLVHVSTAYANCNRSEIEEMVYSPPVHPRNVIESLEWLDTDLDVLTEKLCRGWPNTYTFAKNFAEYILYEECRDLPVAVVRPSIVGASWKDPFPGWVDNFNGPTGLFVAIGKGLLRTMLGDVHATADIIPVDIVTNMMLAAAWFTVVKKPKVIQIYNCTTGQLNRLTWGQVEKVAQKYFVEQPLSNIIRVPDPHFTASRVWYSIRKFADQRIPAYIIDFFLALSGRRRRIVRIYDKIEKSVHSLDYFTMNQWVFHNDNVNRLWNAISDEDRQDFDFCIPAINWEKYLENYCNGTKIYALGESMDELPQHKKHFQKVERVTRVANIIALALVVLLITKREVIFKGLHWLIMLYLKQLTKIVSFVIATF